MELIILQVNIMYINSQRLEYKICPLDMKYSRKIEENLAASHETFSDLQTPGWSSLMKSQISDKTKRTNNDKDVEEGLKQISIYNKLNQPQPLKWTEKGQKKMMKVPADVNDSREINRASRKTIKDKQFNQSTDKIEKNVPKRWNQISVYEHLYQNSLKMENKRMINKILDDEFKKKQIFRFAPQINKKSIMLAESKFSRVKETEKQLKIQQQTLQTEATDVREKQDREVQRYRTLNKVFYFLSEGKTLLVEQSLQDTLQKLPLPCITVIQPIISKIYKGEQMEWLDFLENFNDKKIKGKQGFFALISKWFARNQKKDSIQQ